MWVAQYVQWRYCVLTMSFSPVIQELPNCYRNKRILVCSDDNVKSWRRFFHTWRQKWTLFAPKMDYLRQLREGRFGCQNVANINGTKFLAQTLNCASSLQWWCSPVLALKMDAQILDRPEFRNIFWSLYSCDIISIMHNAFGFFAFIIHFGQI